MKETENQSGTIEEKKAKIRERYKGVDPDQLSVIPAIPKIDIFDRERTMRVAIYARVSTDDPNQTSSYELQKNHYADIIKANPNWELVDIYADEGISGTSLQHRDSFLRMIADCEAGKIDLIVTKSVSRFARNLLDSVGYIRKLAALKPPVGVFFETENLNTLNSQSEMSIAFISTMAQEESHNKSEIMNVSIEMRFKRGIFLTPPLLGYDLNEEGKLIINQEEAKTVRLIFFLYLIGYTCQQIADTLNRLKRKTKKGNINWTGSSVMQQLQNERHCGSVLARKTFTPSYLDHKSKKNRQDRNQYIQKVHHEPIVSREDFIAVQHIIQNTRRGHKNILPELHVIPEGTFQGYVCINPRWSGFKPEDYLAASASVNGEDEPEDESTMTVHAGEFDLRGFEVVRSEFLNIAYRKSVSFSVNRIKFSVSAVRQLNCEYVNLLIHPKNQTLIVRPTKADDRLAFQWAKKKNGALAAKEISAGAILPCLFDLLGWDHGYRYCILGSPVDRENGQVLYFRLKETQIFIPHSQEGEDKEKPSAEKSLSSGNIQNFGTKNATLAFPASWANSFGSEYYLYRHSFEASMQQMNLPLIIPTETSVYNPRPDIIFPDQQDLAKQIEIIMNDMETEEAINE